MRTDGPYRARAPARTADGPAYSVAVNATPPRIMVLGGPVPEPLQHALRGNIELVPEGPLAGDEVAGVLVHARPEALAAVRRFRMSGGQLAIYGLAGATIPMNERLTWIREGADDLLSIDNAASVLVRRLRGPPARPAPEGIPPGVRIDRYLKALERYLVLRSELERRLGADAAERLRECFLAREDTLAASELGVPAVGSQERRQSGREEISWPATLTDRGGGCELVDVGPDGVRLKVGEPLAPGEWARVAVDGLERGGVLAGEVRWCAPGEGGTFGVGLFLNAVEVRRLA